MHTRSKSDRRKDNMLCKEASKIGVVQPSIEGIRIAQQEAAMWAQYRAELDRIAHTPVGEPKPFVPHEDIEEVTPTEVETDSSGFTAPDGHSRFEVTDFGPSRLFPTGKGNHTSGDKRYGPIVRKSDHAKVPSVYGKPKGKSYTQLKKAKKPLYQEDFDFPTTGDTEEDTN